MFPFDYFTDPRFRQDRIRNVAFYFVALVLLSGTVALLLWQQKKIDAQGRKLASSGSASREIVSLEKGPSPAAKPSPASDTAPPPPDAPASLITAAQRAYASGDKDTARTLLAKVDLNKANSPLGWEIAGLLQADAGQPREAEEIYSKGILAISTPSAELHYRRALLFRDKGDLLSALGDLEKAAALSPRDDIVSNERYLLLIQLGRKDQVREEIIKQLSSGVKTEKNAWILGLAGVALENGQFAEAAQMFEHAKNTMNRDIFRHLIGNPMLSRYQNRPEIFPFYLESEISPSP